MAANTGLIPGGLYFVVFGIREKHFLVEEMIEEESWCEIGRCDA